MNYSPKISIIIPIYNAEKYLCRCVDSIIVQTFTDFELLLIDDGSLDDSKQICDKYARKDIRIQVFHKENGGVASARQLGMDYVRGKYFIHVDSDDWIEPDMLERMVGMAEAENAEIVVSDFFIDRRGGEIVYKKQEPSLVDSKSFLQEILKGKLIGTLWNKLVCTDLWKKCNAHFINGINYCEDILVLAQLLQYCHSISYLSYAFYHYCDDNKESITRNYTRETYHMRKKYISALNGIVSELSLLQIAALEVKMEAFRHNLLSVKDFYNYYPVSYKVILGNKTEGKTITYLFILGKCGLYPFVKIIWNLKKFLDMIPKVIHYCWFGRNTLPPLAVKCIESWKKYFPDYEIKEWNEENFNVNIIPYTKEAYEMKKYAFVSDYARFWILYHYGGLYFDTDVEVIRPMDDIIDKGPFMGCEKNIDNNGETILAVAPGLGLGANPGLGLYSELLQLYSTLHFIEGNGVLNLKTVVEYTTELLCYCGLKNCATAQKIAGILIYPREYFNPKDYATGKIVITKNTRSIHHFAASWLPEYQRRNLRIYNLLGINQDSKWIALLRRIKKIILSCLK